jgi:NADPH-dependent F420 reductase
MRIAIIGTGNVGSGLARACVAAGHEVVLTARHAEHAMKVASDVGGTAAASNREAVEGAELVVLAVPSTAVASILDDVGSLVAGKTLVDPTNPANRDYSDILSASGSVSEGIQLLAPEAVVVKAFNTVFASRLTDPVIDGIPLDGFYAGDDEAAKSTVAQLLAAIGFRPLDAGPLLAARALEMMALLNMNLNARNGWPWRSGWKLLGPTG